MKRRGYTLVLFVMLLWVMFGLAALVIDFGLARVTQQRMQDATDAAALEGLRYAEAAQGKEKARQIATSNFLHEIGETVTEYNQAEIVLSGGLGGENLLAGQLIEDPTGRRWIPQPRTNDDSADLYHNGTQTEFSAHLIRDGQTPTINNNYGPRSPNLFGRASVSPNEGVIGIPIWADSKAILRPVTTLVRASISDAPKSLHAIEIADLNMLQSLPPTPEDFTFHVGEIIPSFLTPTTIADPSMESGYVVLYRVIDSVDSPEPDRLIVGFGYWNDGSLRNDPKLLGPASFCSANPRRLAAAWYAANIDHRSEFQTRFNALKDEGFLLTAPVLAPSPIPYP